MNACILYITFILIHQQRNGQENSFVAQRSRGQNRKTHPVNRTGGNEGQQNQKEKIVPSASQPAKSNQ